MFLPKISLFFISSGSGLGTLIIGPLFHHMFESVGLVLTLRCLSVIFLLLLLAALGYKSFRSPLENYLETEKPSHQFCNFGLWTSLAFVVYTGSVALFMLAYFIPYVHLVSNPWLN